MTLTDDDFLAIRQTVALDLIPAGNYAKRMIEDWGSIKLIQSNMEAILDLAYESAYTIARNEFKEASDEDFDKVWNEALDWHDYDAILRVVRG